MFNRPLPLIDGPTLAMLIAGAILLCAQAIFDFTLYSFLPGYVALPVYLFAGFSGVWQFMRQA
jgi:hypothetical protein